MSEFIKSNSKEWVWEGLVNTLIHPHQSTEGKHSIEEKYKVSLLPKANKKKNPGRCTVGLDCDICQLCT